MRFYNKSNEEPYAVIGKEQNDRETRNVELKPHERIVGAGFEIRDSIPVSI